jgi:hypothetical protein
VRAKTLGDGGAEATLELTAVNQRDETIALGEAVVLLPMDSDGGSAPAQRP